MKIVFIQISRDTNVEYSIHKMLAEHADQRQIDSYFVWQDSEATRKSPALLGQSNHNFYYNFGRVLSMSPKPTRLQRALLMARKFPGSLIQLFRLTKSIMPHALYTSQQDYDLYVARLLSIIFRIPHIVHVNYPLGPWLSKASIKLVVSTPHIFACSEYVRQTIINHGASPDQVRVIYNPADVKQFDLFNTSLSIRTEYNLPSNARLIVSAGRLDPSKGHYLLIDAFAQVHKVIPNAYVLICGSTFTRSNYDQVLRERVKEFGLSDHVIFLGQRPDLPQIFHESDIFSLPTINEAFGLVFPEAMAASLPVVAVESGGVPEIVLDRVTGLLSPADDAEKLAQNLIYLLQNPEVAQQFGRKGRARALEMFEPSQLAPQWTRLLQNVVSPYR